MEQNTFCKADSQFVGQEISFVLWQLKVY